MADIHVVTHRNAASYTSLLSEYHRIRHQVFVEERGWEALRKSDGVETDQFDDEHAVHLLAVDGSKLVGGQRLYPTTRPHMISEVFPHLAPLGLRTGPTVLEWTRYFVVKERRFGRTDGRMLAAVQDYCLEEGMTELTAVVEIWWLPRWQQYGFSARPLGLPQMVGGQPTVAVSIDVSEQALDSVRRLCGLRASGLIRNGLDISGHREVAHAA